MQDQTCVKFQVTRETSSLMVLGAGVPCRDWLGMHHLAELFWCLQAQDLDGPSKSCCMLDAELSHWHEDDDRVCGASQVLWKRQKSADFYQTEA